jgi:hypothetical protein
VAVYLIYLTSTSPCLRDPSVASVGPRHERKECMSSCGRRKDHGQCMWWLEFGDEDEVEEGRNQPTVKM